VSERGVDAATVPTGEQRRRYRPASSGDGTDRRAAATVAYDRTTRSTRAHEPRSDSPSRRRPGRGRRTTRRS